MRRLETAWRTVVLFVIVAYQVAGLWTGVAWADASDPGGSFADDDGTVAEGAIEAIALEGVTFGCNPPGNYRYCPHGSVNRGQMAAFLARARALPASATDHFVDDNESLFEGAINRLADAGITQGCNPPENTMFCPDRTMTRGEMAAFIARAFELPPSSTDWFVDDDGTIFEAAINGVADARIALGCNPPSNTNYCPSDTMNRGQMAIFLTRALDLAPLAPPRPVRVPVLSVIDGNTIVVSLDGVDQTVRLIGIDVHGPGHECFDESFNAMSALVGGKTVRIDTDVTDRDSLGRMLRYVFLSDGTFVNAEMIELGRAAAAPAPPDTEFDELLASVEEEAQAADKGMFDTGGCDHPIGDFG